MLRLLVGVETWNGLIPHTRVGVKNQERYLSYRDLSWESRSPFFTLVSPTLDSSARKSLHNFWLWKVEILADRIVAKWDKKLLESQILLLKDLQTNLVMNSFTISSSAGTAARKMPGTYRKKLNCLTSRQGLKRELSSRHKCWQKNVHLLYPPQPRLQVQMQTCSISKSPLT